MSIELGRRLIAAGAVHPSEIEAAFYRQLIAGIPFVRAILELGHITEEALEQELAASMVPFLATIVPLPALVDELPQQMCRRLMAVPVRRDPRTGLIDVAAVDPFDAHIVYEFSYQLKSEVRILRGSLATIEQALTRIDRGEYSASVILRKSVRPPGYATPSAPPLRSDRPIPLVRKSKRRQSVEVHAVRDITGPSRQAGDAPADNDSPEVPPAPSLPSFGRGGSQPGSRPRQQTAPGPPGVPARNDPPPAAPSTSGRPEVPSRSVSARSRPEVPGAAPVTARGRPEVPSAAPSGARSRPEVPGGSPASARGRPEVHGAALGRETSGSPSGAKAHVAPAGTPEPPSAPSGGAGVKPRAQGGPPPPPAKVPTPASSAASAAAAKASASRHPSASGRARQGASPSPAPAAPGAKRRSSSPPPTARGPFSPRAPVAPFPDIGVVLTAMESAATRDEVIDCLIVGMSTVARRVGVFAVKKGCYRGVACNRELGNATRFRGIEISAEATTVLGIAATSGSYLGPLPVTQPHEDLLAFMKDVSNEVCATLIRVAGRPAVILFAESLGDAMIATRRAEALGHDASLAFSRILTEAKGRGRG